jgi:release factor glutamine methyltransferase
MSLDSTNLGLARRSIIEALRGAEIPDATLEADLMLVRLLRIPRASVLGHPEKILTGAELDLIKNLTGRRAAGEPLQYVLGEAHFWGMTFDVGEGVLIPRPETEFLVEMALKRIPNDAHSLFLDWGTGSGCVAIALLAERPNATAVMAEKNPRSLVWAWRNLQRHGLMERAMLWHSREPGDIPAGAQKNNLGLFDLVVSNPPYIPAKDLAGLMREVRHEPPMALDGGEDGMDCYRKLFQSAPLLLRAGGWLVLEIGDALQAEKLRKTPQAEFIFVEETADLSGKPRCMTWCRRV